jgi:hypothetical protein
LECQKSSLWQTFLSRTSLAHWAKQYPGALVILSGIIGQKEEEELWNIISRNNDEVEAHSRIDRNMVALITADKLKPEKSSKGTILRGSTEDKFAKHIEELYEGKNRSLLPVTAQIQDSEVGSVTRKLVHGVLGFMSGVPVR